MTRNRKTPIEISKETFQKIGHDLIDQIAEFINTMEDRKVTSADTPSQIRTLLGNHSIPEEGSPPDQLLRETNDLLINHSLFNGHPKFMGYITSSPSPIGILADLLASNINANVGANVLSPLATGIESQTIQWLAEFINVSPDHGGVLVSGGNMANLTAFLAGRTAMAPDTFKAGGLQGMKEKMLIYCSKATHTWIEKAAVLFGHGTDAIRWIDVDAHNRIRLDHLEETIVSDRAAGHFPFIVIGTAGDVSTGVVDDLQGISALCNKHQLWFHVDGAYGIPAAALPELHDMFKGIEEADSIAMDPHKWLYAPLEVGCTLVRKKEHLIHTYSSHPSYYNFENYGKDQPTNYYEFGFQNSRGFRALKVWLALRQVGKEGYTDMIREDIAVSRLMAKLADEHPELEKLTQHLSIATLRYVPEGFRDNEPYLNELNEKLLNDLQNGGEVFLSNALIGEKYGLRGCIVNFRTSRTDAEEIIAIIVREGRRMHAELQGNRPSG